MFTKFESLPNTSRIWIYQTNPAIPEHNIAEIKSKIQEFVNEWTAHNHALQGYGGIFHNQFIVLAVDESRVGASGCSIDKSVHFIQNLEREFNLNCFDRMTFAWKDGARIKTASRDEFAKLFADGKINESTPVFDNLVKTKGDFEMNWLKPLGESWHIRMV